jgi:spore coat polysaccharide biosynthesis predicted glycosyltransferase SpsG
VAICQPIDHQLELASSLAGKGAMVTVGDGLAATEEQIMQAIKGLVSYEKRLAMSQVGPNLIDGRGTLRVVQILMDVAGSS